MQDKKHLEWKVTEWEMNNGEFKILRKELTKRGSVMISERDCNTNNFQTQFSKLWYSLAVDDNKMSEEAKAERSSLFHEARKVYNLTVSNNATNDELKTLIESAKLDAEINAVKN